MEDVVRQRRKRGVRLTLLGGVVFAALLGVYLLADIFAPLIAGFLIAYVLDPFADALERVRFSRLAAVITIFAVFTLFGLILSAAAGYGVSQGIAGTKNALFGDEWIRTPDKVESPESRAQNPKRPDYADLNGNSHYDPHGERPKKLEEDATYPEDIADYQPDVHFEDNDGDGKFDPPEPWLATWDQVENPIIDRHYRDRNDDGKFQPGYIRRLKKRVDELLAKEWADDLRGGFEDYWSHLKAEGPLNFENSAAVEEWVGRVQSGWDWLTSGSKGGDSPLGGGFSFISWFVFCPLYVFFFLLEIDPLIAAVRRYLPGKHRPMIEDIFAKIDKVISAFFRGRLLICFVKGLLTWIALQLVGVDYAFILGFAAGFLSLIPYIGIWLALIPALLIGWVEHGSLLNLVMIAGVFGVMEGVEGFVLVPGLMGKDVGLHPLTIMVTLLIFGRIFGFIGVLLSVPMAAITKILGEQFIMPLIREFAAEKPDPPDDSDPSTDSGDEIASSAAPSN